MKKLVFVCLGNICRSPMAEFVMKSMTDNYEIQSRATSSWEHGNPIHKGTQGIFQEYEIPYDKGKTSLQISKEDFEAFDYIIGMDASNVSDLRQMCPVDCQDKIYSFASEAMSCLFHKESHTLEKSLEFPYESDCHVPKRKSLDFGFHN